MLQCLQLFPVGGQNVAVSVYCDVIKSNLLYVVICSGASSHRFVASITLVVPRVERTDDNQRRSPC